MDPMGFEPTIVGFLPHCVLEVRRLVQARLRVQNLLLYN